MTDTYMGSVLGGSYFPFSASGESGALVGVYKGKNSTRYPDLLEMMALDRE